MPGRRRHCRYRRLRFSENSRSSNTSCCRRRYSQLTSSGTLSCFTIFNASVCSSTRFFFIDSLFITFVAITIHLSRTLTHSLLCVRALVTQLTIISDTFSSCSRVVNRCRSITSRHYSHYSSCSFQLCCTSSSSPRSLTLLLTTVVVDRSSSRMLLFFFSRTHTHIHTPTQTHHHSLIIIVVSDSDTEPCEQSSLTVAHSRELRRLLRSHLFSSFVLTVDAHFHSP